MTLDAEYNQPSKKCIQIGAAIYDVKTADCHGTFEIFVNPGELINPYITELTGIKDSDVSDAPNIKEAYFELKSFFQKHKPFRNPLVWGSGVSNDSLAIWQESGTEEENFMGFRVLDAKTIYQSVMIHGNRNFAGGLSDCMRRLGLNFEGESHTALADAKNTFSLWFFMMKKFQK